MRRSSTRPGAAGGPAANEARWSGVALAWTAAVVWPLWDDDGTALVLAVVFVAIAAAARSSAPGRRSRAIAGRGLAAASILCAAIAADALRSLAGAAQGVTDVTVLGYSAAVALTGVVLFKAAMLDAPASLAERAVALERGGVTLRTRCATCSATRSSRSGSRSVPTSSSTTAAGRWRRARRIEWRRR